VSDKPNIEFETVSKKHLSFSSSRRRFSKQILIVLCCAIPTILLGLWSIAHQVSYAPPPAEARLVVMRKIQRLQVVPLDELLIPEQDSSVRWILGDGFSQPEAGGVWITALRSSLNFSIDSWTKVPKRLTLTLAPLLGPSRPHRILTVSSAGSTVTKTISGLDVITIPLDGEFKQTVNISCDSIDSALSLRLGPDYRPMCAKLISLMVKSD
jgi:hypothetical protein